MAMPAANGRRKKARVIGSDAGFKYFCGVCWSKIREADSGPR